MSALKGSIAWKIVAGVLVADFLTAAVHWAEDTYLPHSEAPGMLGDIARENDMHHFIPFSITVGSYWDNCRVSFKLLAMAGAALLAIAPRWAAKHRVFLITLALAMGVTNLAHRFQHERDCRRPTWITALQRMGVLCSREQHSVHHEQADVRYGVLLGFTNWVYDTFKVWRILEAVLSVFGLKRHARKQGVGAYKALYGPWLTRNMALDCPKGLSRQRLDRYYERLAAAYRDGRLRGGTSPNRPL